MILPYNTDAPIYHFPYATIGLIVANTLVFVFTAQAEPEQVIPWLLQFGEGLHPLQWLTNNFLHADFMHLFGNMFYLWGFGLVVEGKLGAARMLLLYLVIGVVYGAIIQLVMLGSDGGALGASGVIFGLVAIALVWAPRNEISCFVWFVYPTTVELSIVFFASTFLAWQLFVAWLSGFGMSSEMLHLTGAGLGAVAGVALLKLEMVDCEGWDAFAVWQGREGESQRKAIERPSLLVAASPAVVSPVQPLRPAVAQRGSQLELKSRLRSGDVEGAFALYLEQRRVQPGWTLAEPDLMALIQALHQSKLWSESIRPMVDYLQEFPEGSERMRLKLAQILIVSERRPVKAIQVLSRVSEAELPAELRETHRKLLAKAEAIRDECELEIADDEDW